MKEIAFKNLAEQFRFENGLAGVKTVAFGHLFLLVVILVWTGETVGFNTYGFFSLISGLLIFLGTLFYNWSNTKINLAFLASYLLILAVEYSALGFPPPVMNPGRGISKGFLLDMAISMVPFIYIGIRIACILPLAIICYRSSKL